MSLLHDRCTHRVSSCDGSQLCTSIGWWPRRSWTKKVVKKKGTSHFVYKYTDCSKTFPMIFMIRVNTSWQRCSFTPVSVIPWSSSSSHIITITTSSVWHRDGVSPSGALSVHDQGSKRSTHSSTWGQDVGTHVECCGQASSPRFFSTASQNTTVLHNPIKAPNEATFFHYYHAKGMSNNGGTQ